MGGLHEGHAIRYRVPERQAVQRHDVRCFCLSSQQLSADAMAVRFLASLDAITQACAAPGPFIYAVHAKRIERLALAPST